jgi:anti-anti-sigma factor
MTDLHNPTSIEGNLVSCYESLTIDRDGVEARTHYRHLATVVTISGEVDASNIALVTTYATRFVLVGNALLLDLSDVGFFAVQGISALNAVDEACHSTQVPWALVTSHAVDRVLRISQRHDVLPAVRSVPDALQYFAHTRMRPHVPLSARRRSAPGMPLETSAGSR